MSGKATVVILPTYQEASNLKLLVPRLQACGVDILVMDDSPTTETVEVARELGCRAIRREGPRGRILALLEGIAKSPEYANIITMDADMQHPPELIPAIVDALHRYDIVVGSRNVSGGGYLDFPLRRRIVSNVAKLLAWPLAPKLKDRSSGYVAFRKRVLNGHKLPLGFSTLTLSLFVYGQYRSFVELPYIFARRAHGESKLSTRLILDHLKQLAKLYLAKFRLLRYAIVGGTGALLGLAVLYTLADVAHLQYLVAYAISFVVAATSNYIWNSLWTFKKRRGIVGWIKCLLVYTGTLAIDTTLMFLLTDKLGLWYMLSAVLVTVVAFAINYLVSRRVVWNA